MNSTADFLFTPEEAAEAALDFLFRLQAPEGAAVWGKPGTVWQCLASRGDCTGLPVPTALSGELSWQPPVQCHPLGSPGQPLGWLLWHGARQADELTRRL